MTAEDEAMARAIAATKRPGDLVVASGHWGGNWGHAVPAEHRRLAHRLIDAGADLINDYEGIRGHDACFPAQAVLVAGRLGWSFA